jgi:hypothetical protein
MVPNSRSASFPMDRTAARMSRVSGGFGPFRQSPLRRQRVSRYQDLRSLQIEPGVTGRVAQSEDHPSPARVVEAGAVLQVLVYPDGLEALQNLANEPSGRVALCSNRAAT